MNNIGYYNGKTGPIEEMTIPMNDRAAYFGDGVYDATMCKNGVVFLAREHMDRFFGNLNALKIAPPMEKEALISLLHELAARVDGDEKFIYWQSSRGVAKRAHVFPENAASTLYITVTPMPVKNIYAQIPLITYEDKRFEYCHIKTLCLMPSVLAAQAAEEAGCGEAVLHRNGVVTECAHSNVSILSGGALRTHPADQFILPGIARRHILLACGRLGIPVSETAFTLREMMEADEIIVSSSTKFCQSACRVDGRAVGGKAPELLKAIQTEIETEFLREVGAL